MTNSTRSSERLDVGVQRLPGMKASLSLPQLGAALDSLGDAVIALGASGVISYLNSTAEYLTGWSNADAVGKPLSDVFRIVERSTTQRLENSSADAQLGSKAMRGANEFGLLGRNGLETTIEKSESQIRIGETDDTGTLIVFRVVIRPDQEHDFSQSRLELDDFFENAAVPLHWVGPEGTILRANLAELNLLGYSREEYFGRHITEFHVDQDVIEKILNRLVNGDTLRDVSARLRCKDGSIRNVKINSNGLFVGGRFIHSRCVTLDVTKQARAEAILTESEERFRTLADAAPVLIWMAGADKEGIYFNKPWLDFTGKPAAEQLGDGWLDLVHPEDRKAIYDTCMEGYRNRKPFSTEFRLRRSDGQYRWLLDTGAPRFDRGGQFAGFIGSCVDITDRKQAEAALKSKEAELQLIAESTPLILSRCSRDLRYLFVNRAAATLFGRTPDEMIGVRIIDIMGEKVFGIIRPYVERVLNGESVEYETEIPYQAVGPRWVRVNYVPERNDNGEVTGWIASIVEITKRKRTEAALRASEERYRAIVESQVEMVCRFRLNGAILFVNGAYARSLNTTPEELVGRNFWNYVEERDHDHVREMLDRLSPEAPEVHIENRFETADGTRWTLWTNRGLEFDEQGRALEVQSSGFDITDRKQVEEALRRQSEETRTLLETLPIGVLIAHDSQCRQITANPAVYQMMHVPAGVNLSKTAPLGEAPTSFRICRQGVEIPPDQLPVQRAARGEQIRDEEFEMTLDDGDVINFLMSAAPLYNEAGQSRGAVASMLDVTHRIRMDRAIKFLADTSKSLSSLVDYRSTLQQVAQLAVPHFADWCAVDLLNSEGVLERLAVAHVDPSKVQLAEILHQRYPMDTDSNSPHGAMKVLQNRKSEIISNITDSMLIDGARDQEHLDILRQLGLKSYMCVPLEGKGISLGVISFVSAESGRRYDADDLGFAEELSNRAAIAIENARLYQEAREADRRKDEFLAMLAHELRNPLAPIQSGLDILAMDETGDHETLQLMQENFQHLTRMVDDLLDVARIMRGMIELRKEPVELSTVIRRSVSAVTPLLESHQVEIVIQSPKPPMWLNADRVRVVQIIENLLNNAAKYSDAHGLIEVSIERGDGQAIITVKDSGIGIEAELLSQVFEPFTQSPRSLDRSRGGLGIGLTLVRRLVELHEGTISAHSDGPGRGSTFVVRLPVAVAPAPDVQAVVESKSQVQCRRILVVDDNHGAARMLATLLGKLGDHEAEAVYDGCSALERIRDWRPEIVLLDIGLPDMDGYQVARTIRQNRNYDNIQLVALTGYGQLEDRKLSQDAGFDKHLVKPVKISLLEKILGERYL